MSEEEFLVYLDGLSLSEARGEALFQHRQAAGWKEIVCELTRSDAWWNPHE